VCLCAVLVYVLWLAYVMWFCAVCAYAHAVSLCGAPHKFHLGQTITAIEGTGSATKQWSGVVVEVDQCDEVFIICCENVPNYPHGYMMVVPFSEAKTRINQQLHGRKRKSKRKQIQSM